MAQVILFFVSIKFTLKFYFYAFVLCEIFSCNFAKWYCHIANSIGVNAILFWRYKCCWNCPKEVGERKRERDFSNNFWISIATNFLSWHDGLSKQQIWHSRWRRKKGKWEEKGGGGGWRKKSLFGWESEKSGAEGINLSAKIIRRDSEVYRMTRKEWKTRCQFHQRSTYSFCTRRSQKCKKYSYVISVFLRFWDLRA